jgi:hypothetical protein
MTPAEKASAVTAMTRASIEMTRAGIRHRYPEESAESHRKRLAEILLAPELAHRVYGKPEGP